MYSEARAQRRIALNVDVDLEADVDRLSSLWPLVVAQSLRFARMVYFVERNQDEDGERVDGLNDQDQKVRSAERRRRKITVI